MSSVRNASKSRNRKPVRSAGPERTVLAKCPSGIQGLDEVTAGGLPRGRPTLVCGGPGGGKSLFGVEFLVRGALEHGEPGVLMTFEESAEEITKNVASLGFDIQKLIAQKKLSVDYVRVERSEIEETGEYDLEGLFVRLGYAIDSIKAKRVVLDTIESLFAGLSNENILRAELRRLFRWLKDKGVTTVITGERGDSSLTRQGLEEYVSDCVIFLDHRVTGQVSTRRMRVVKYRGSVHGTNEYPFLIDEDGITVMPITSAGLAYDTSSERIGSGIDRLDTMLSAGNGSKGGFYRGSSILISGTAGTGKSSIAAQFVNATCKRGERCLYFAFEESRSQIIRNMKSIGLNLEPHVTKGLLKFVNVRPTLCGLEMHLASMHKQIRDFRPSAVIVDPVSNIVTVGSRDEANAMLTRLIDMLKSEQVTSLFTALTEGGNALEATQLGISSMMDTWLLLRDIEYAGERNRGLYVLKSRGMSHSNQIREFVITRKGIDLLDVYVGPAGVLTGSARISQEAREAAEQMTRQEEIERKRRTLERKQKALEARVAALRAEFEDDEEELSRLINEEEQREQQLARDRGALARSRKADVVSKANGNRKH